jgi:hypothetical protein
MGIPFALSIHHFISSVGSDAGFASIIGLAILVFLYFAQMRETATLRDQATESSERVRQLEGRLTQLHRAQAAAAQAIQAAQASQAGQVAQPLRRPPVPAAAPGGVGTPAAPQAAAAVPAAPAPLRIAPAGVGAPALSAATKLIPDGGSVAVATPPPLAPVPFDTDSAPPPPATAAAANGATLAPGGSDTAVPPRVQIRPGVPPTSRRPSGQERSFLPPEDEPSSKLRPFVYGIAGLILLAAVVIGLLSLTSGGSAPRIAAVKTTNAPTATRSRHHGAKVTVDPAKVTVAVLNGTATQLLAQDVSNKLGGFGFKSGAVTNAPDQTHTTTVIQYLPGAANKNDALAVAKQLALSNSAVQPIDASTQTVACPASKPCPPTEVVVTVGLDMSGDAGSASASTGTGTSPAPSSTSTTGTTTAG